MEKKWTKPNVHGICPPCYVWCEVSHRLTINRRHPSHKGREKGWRKKWWVPGGTAEIWPLICPTIGAFSGFSWPPFCYFCPSSDSFCKENLLLSGIPGYLLKGSVHFESIKYSMLFPTHSQWYTLRAFFFFKTLGKGMASMPLSLEGQFSSKMSASLKFICFVPNLWSEFLDLLLTWLLFESRIL